MIRLKHYSLFLITATILVAGSPAFPISEEVIRIHIDGSRTGRVFEGIGALSAGASSRLLIDYPEPQRSQVLDLLFKPDYGASFDHLKVEIGGGGNSTCGSEPSHAYTRQEFENPEQEFFDRGYEWWLMKEARKRNNNIYLEALAWSAPGWIGEGDYYSPDMAEYVASFIEGAQQYHDLEIDFTGIWNETAYDVAWIKQLRSTLDSHGLQKVGIVCCDQAWNQWEIAGRMTEDRELSSAVAVIGEHYPERVEDSPYASSAEAMETEKPLWNAEGGPWSGDWKAFDYLVKLYNRCYIEGRMTKVITWSLVTSYYDNLSLPGSGPMRANAPWCGHFEIQPALWAIAHTTQFTHPGWHYIDDGCGYLPEGRGSYVTLRAPGRQGDYSIVMETLDAVEPLRIRFRISGGLSARPLAVWRTLANDDKEIFQRQEDIGPMDGTITITLLPGAVYSLTTTRGQHRAQPASPPLQPFPMPYKTDFENPPVGGLPKYLSDQSGAFEISERRDGSGKCLRQVVKQPAIEWIFAKPVGMAFQNTVLGDTAWADYQVQVEALLEEPGFVTLLGRTSEMHRAKQPPEGYWLKADTNGLWQIFAGDRLMAQGTIPFSERIWHTLKLWFKGRELRVIVNGNQVFQAEQKNDRKPYFPRGLAGVGSGYNYARFDNLSITPVQ